METETPPRDQPVTGQGAEDERPSGEDRQRTRTSAQKGQMPGTGRLVTLSTGEEVWLNPGWNPISGGNRAYLRKDGSVSEVIGSPTTTWTIGGTANADATGKQAQDLGPAGQVAPAHVTPGNTVGLRHGANSERVLAPVIEELARQAVEAVSWLARPEFQPAVRSWARAEARCQVVADYLDREGVLDAEGNPRPAVNAADRFESQAAKARARLGLDPVSLAQLEATMTSAKLGQASLEEALERGASALAARRASTASAGAPLGSPNPAGGGSAAGHAADAPDGPGL